MMDDADAALEEAAVAMARLSNRPLPEVRRLMQYIIESYTPEPLVIVEWP